MLFWVQLPPSACLGETFTSAPQPIAFASPPFKDVLGRILGKSLG